MLPVDIFSALADETRCTILLMLREGPKPVHQLAGAFEISRPAVSRHLRVLGAAGLVRERKSGRENFYEIRLGSMKKVQTWTAEFLPMARQSTAAKPKKAALAPSRDNRPARQSESQVRSAAQVISKAVQMQMAFDI